MAEIINKNLHNIVILLNEPRYPGNIGASARCLKNMGFSKLRIVNPLNWDQDKILKMATHEASDIIHAAEIFNDLESAVKDLHLLAGTTARTGRKRYPTHTPQTIAPKILSYPSDIKIGILFGSEKWGLKNREIGLCNWIVTIPTANFSSLNLAQSVMILCYELFLATKNEPVKIQIPRLASLQEREGMFRHLQEVFRVIGLYEKQTPAYWLQNARRFFRNKELTAKDVKMIRGFLRQILWAVRHG